MNNTITRQTIVHDAKWLKLVEAEASVRGEATKWLYCSRKQQPGATRSADAVMVVPFVRTPVGVKLIAVREFRIPLGGYQIALPAGLLDEGETPEAAAARELLEETGYEVTDVLDVSPVLPSSAGLTDETFQYVFVEAKAVGAQQLEATEAIEVLAVTLAELRELLHTPEHICGRLWPLAYQYTQQNQYPI
ncbi:NUDIX hydrolase [Cerasicoccus maritimus]|uniref:NUDIX hydrolase n=1 Tax=Cerasicoccus maritimus TaxID=490089 RepID=UPI002852A8B5|nr:NUDIX hydrolase [Cerasicoccus maritimus]